MLNLGHLFLSWLFSEGTLNQQKGKGTTGLTGPSLFGQAVDMFDAEGQKGLHQGRRFAVFDRVPGVGNFYGFIRSI